MCRKVNILPYLNRCKSVTGLRQTICTRCLNTNSMQPRIVNSKRAKFPFNLVQDIWIQRKYSVRLKLAQFSSYTRADGPSPTGSTIFSLSSGHGKCGVAVIRISGPQALDALKLIARFKQTPTSREAILRQLVDPATGVNIDKGIVMLFPGPQSFTGEDCVEFQVHGGPAVVAALLTALHKIPNCRQAEPGEFSKRAFMNGKMDLTEVEGLGDLIHAETEIQRRQALRQMDGDLSKLYSKWRKEFIKCAADLEAFIDFGEDQNIDEHILDQVQQGIRGLQTEIENHLNDKRQGERLREGVHVVIMGEPNVGKSSLLNAICQRPAAIVTDVAGTTRDVIETHINIGGYPVLLSDTAGLRETQDVVEKEGVLRAVKRANEADVKVIVLDVSSVDPMKFENTETFLSQQFTKLGLDNLYKNYGKALTTDRTEFIDKSISDFCKTLIVFNKVDLVQYKEVTKLTEVLGKGVSGTTTTARADNSDFLEQAQVMDSYREDDRQSPVCFISCVTGEGMDSFLDKLKDTVADLCGNPLMGHPSLTQARHRSHLTNCLEHLEQYSRMVEHDDIVLASEEIRCALREIGKITGKISSEEILDVIFRDFCIGK